MLGLGFCSSIIQSESAGIKLNIRGTLRGILNTPNVTKSWSFFPVPANGTADLSCPFNTVHAESYILGPLLLVKEKLAMGKDPSKHRKCIDCHNWNVFTALCLGTQPLPLKSFLDVTPGVHGGEVHLQGENIPIYFPVPLFFFLIKSVLGVNLVLRRERRLTAWILAGHHSGRCFTGIPHRDLPRHFIPDL